MFKNILVLNKFKIYNFIFTIYNSKDTRQNIDQETGLYYYGARYYNPTLSIWASVDPMSDKYPSMSPYMYCAGNPVILIDPDGREFYIADNEQSRNDILSLVNDENRKYISFDDKTGRIKIKTDALSDNDFDADAGLSLLLEMDLSDKKMLYESTEQTTINDENCKTYGYFVYNKRNNYGIINASVGGKDGFDLNIFKPKDGFDGQVSIVPSGKFWRRDGRNGRTSVVFHELAENYYRTHFGYDYNPNSSNNNYGAHKRAADREGNRFGNTTPGTIEVYGRK